MVGLLVVIIAGTPLFRGTKIHLSRAADRCSLPVFGFFILLVGVSAVIVLFFRTPEFPILPYDKGIGFFIKKDYSTAKSYFKQVIEKFPQTVVSDAAAFHYAICFYLEKDWERSILELKKLLESYPETRRAAEAWYHIGMCHIELGESQKALATFEETIRRFPKSIWSGFAADRIRELRLP
jgi:TolA-binding protein